MYSITKIQVEEFKFWVRKSDETWTKRVTSLLIDFGNQHGSIWIKEVSPPVEENIESRQFK